MLKLDCCFSQP